MMNGDWGNGTAYGNDSWSILFMVFMMALVIIGVIVLVRYMVHGAANHRHGAETALDVLEKRYANSEIDKKEFEEKRKVLSD